MVKQCLAFLTRCVEFGLALRHLQGQTKARQSSAPSTLSTQGRNPSPIHVRTFSISNFVDQQIIDFLGSNRAVPPFPLLVLVVDLLEQLNSYARS